MTLMDKKRYALHMLFAAGLACTPLAAHAVAQRTFGASTGSDANATNNCSLALPCRTFAAALGVTAPNGEVVFLDCAGYGGVLIDKSVSITAPSGTYAGISVSSGNGITIAGTGIRVMLRGLVFNG